MKEKNRCSCAILISLMSIFLILGLPQFSDGETPPSRIIFIQIDSLHPEYINLNSEATGPGGQGDWLMPQVREFLAQSAHWPNAKSQFPQSTDPNVLNILSSGNSGTTGLVGVQRQPEFWGLFRISRGYNHLRKTRYPNGNQVKTIFDILKEQTSNATIAFISNKNWVPLEYDASYDNPAFVDIIVNGITYPPYVDVPEYVSFYDNPDTDPDAFCDPESEYQTTLFGIVQNYPEIHPRDFWIVDAALQVMANETPDMMYVLLGDLDHGQHLLGAVNDPSEWMIGPVPDIPAECENQPRYRWINRRNEKLYKEPILDLIQDVDATFGLLIDSLEEGGYLQDTAVILVSDHNMENYLYREGIEQDTDVTRKLRDAGLAPRGKYAIHNGASTGFLYWRPWYKLFNPFVTINAKEELQNVRHMAYNHVTGVWELPWHVLDRQEMINGRPDLGIDVMEVYNDFFVRKGVWPDLLVVMKAGWQLHSYPIIIGGEKYPILNAGHGSPNTSAVMLAIRGLGFPAGASCAEEAKLSDVAITISEYMAWSFPEANGTPLVCQPQ
jgi:hypothetical protein